MSQPREDAARLARLAAATAGLDPPFAVVDLDALHANATDLARRACGTPIRVASKSVRARGILDLVLALPGFGGIMAFAVREALWLAELGATDVLLGYPSADRGALAELAGSEHAGRVTLMIDDIAHLDLVDAALPPGSPRRQTVQVCIDVDASLRVGPLHLGVRRSPLRIPGQVAGLAREVAGRPGFSLAGVMFYEAQVAGLPDTGVGVRLVKARSLADLAVRRGAVVDAVRDVVGHDLRIVNSGGSGSVAESAADPAVTEVTAGSGLYVPTLFDRYRSFTPRPAAWFVLPVVRRPAPRIATLFGGGYIASGPPGPTRLPRPVYPAGLTLLPTEGAGEVQTPVRGSAAAALRIGDRVWLRHAKAGELCERFDVLHLVRGGEPVGSIPTYRGERQTFG